ncbi:hypothetical protein QNO08_07815 [Arthrobacter sp. zg-Y820]|uniref:hypothetical protein n=1 Tax=unclassified Arthrobacter TaxID=235627 RepID=UPI001E40A9A2|nr:MULTISPECIES: hypothetical protein [unclassified Arthrobacter]MCC9197574.1 hypothetical protein [Arthrobacter sp. zg-Y820]MDK1280441.1 hypothetical protein [Arthrobacter sp. zg.Y820]WIB10915.1 hypothetical protein QNO08_07815 [Arthrobacter sp. zg-Y820]
MRKAVTSAAIALLLVTGCSAEAAESGAPAATATSEPSVEPVALNAEEQTCIKLLGTDGKGPLYDAIYLVKIGDGTSGFLGTAETASLLNEEIAGIARNAPEGMDALLEELSSPMENAALRAEHPDSPWSLNVATWTGAVAQLLTRCASYETGAGSAASPAAPAPSAVEGIGAAYPGYPLVVNVESLDYRVAAWFDGKLVDGQVVALAPGLYAPYDPNIPDLLTYYVADGVAGDSPTKQAVFPGSGAAATWSNVSPGPQEPQ